jgi:hypothetical protein
MAQPEGEDCQRPKRRYGQRGEYVHPSGDQTSRDRGIRREVVAEKL